MKQQDQNTSISLNKYLSNTGLCSRREADKLIEDGKVTLNGVIAKKGNRVEVGDSVLLDGKPIESKQDFVYIMFNKPQGIVCTTDQSEPQNIVDFIGYEKRIFPIGRIDKGSEGLILLTNDGDIVNKILRAGNMHEKEYIVEVNQPITDEFIRSMQNGIPILGTKTKKCVVNRIDDYSFSIILTQGLNRQIRRMCEYLDYRVTFLKRTRIMHLRLRGLRRGEWRYLLDSELEQLITKTEFSKKTAD